MNQETRTLFTRLGLGALAMYLATLSTLNFIGYASSPTDENWFSDAPSRLYVTQNVVSTASSIDALNIGDLITAINQTNLDDSSAFVECLAAIGNEEILSLSVHRPKEGKRLRLMFHKSDFPPQFFSMIPHSVEVIDITPNGASDKAGMKVGDLIYRINGLTFSEQGEADLIMRQGGAGKTVVYEVIRENQNLLLNVTLAAWGFGTSKFLLWLGGLLAIGIGFLIAWRGKLDGVAVLVCVGSMFIGASISMIQMQRDISDVAFSITRGITTGISVYVGFAMLIHLRFSFPLAQPYSIFQKKWVGLSPYLFAAIQFVAAVTGAFSGSLAVLLLPIALVGLELTYFFSKSWRTNTVYRQMNSPIVYTTIAVFGIIGILTILTVVFLFKIRDVLIDYAILSIVAIPLAYLYVIGKYRLFEVELRVKRTIQYTTLTIGFYIGLSAGFLYTIALLLSLPIQVPDIQLTLSYINISDHRSDVAEKFILMLIAIGVAWLFLKLKTAGRRFLDKRFYRAGYDYRRASDELGEALSATLTLTELTRNISKKIANLMNLRAVAVTLFPNAKIRSCSEGYGIQLENWKIFSDEKVAALAQFIEQMPTDSRISTDALPLKFRAFYEEVGIRCLIPIRSQEKLLGSFLIGEKLSEEPFQQEDFRFLMAAARQASVAIENAILHEELTEQERIKHELSIARQIQLSSLPVQSPKIEGLDVSGVSVPAQEVGGDYFDYLNGRERELMVVVGDVSGKGTSAALYMSKVQGMMRSLHSFHLSPKELLSRTNVLLAKDLHKNSFITVIGASFHTVSNEVILARAGHLPLIYFSYSQKSVSLIQPKGMGLGIVNGDMFETHLEEKHLFYQKGDIFVFVSDGITEARDAEGREFGMEKLKDILIDSFDKNARSIRVKIMDQVKFFSGDLAQFDDQTIVVVKAG